MSTIQNANIYGTKIGFDLTSGRHNSKIRMHLLRSKHTYFYLVAIGTLILEKKKENAGNHFQKESIQINSLRGPSWTTVSLLLVNILHFKGSFYITIQPFVRPPFPSHCFWMSDVQVIKCFENTLEKEKIAREEQFLLFPQCFLPARRTFHHFHQI